MKPCYKTNLISVKRKIMNSNGRMDSLRKLFVDNGLHKEDAYKDPRGFVIITRTGIEKIQAKHKIAVSFEPIQIALDFVVIKAVATAEMPDGIETLIETFGEASKANTHNDYIVAMAEKRALSRAVLKLSGFYMHGAYGEDEIDKSTQNGQLAGRTA